MKYTPNLMFSESFIHQMMHHLIRKIIMFGGSLIRLTAQILIPEYNSFRVSLKIRSLG